ncbi:MAG TPA: VWA domain-containing protein [Thermoanaerobaculia bacterium]|nr:VWA domain-containing protein [Thermoanaerobaculia bacterium]
MSIRLASARAALVAFALATLALLVGPRLAGQSGAPDRAAGPYIARGEEVSITNIDVVVTDSKGKRVTGLKKEDFVVFEDGIDQPVTNFYAVEQGHILLPAEEPPSAPAVPAAPTAPAAPGAPPAAAAAPQPAPKTRIVFFVDNLHILPFDRNRVLRNVETFVRDNVKGDVEGMIITFNRTLKVRRKFTNDGRDLSDVLKQIEEESALGTNAASDKRDVIQAIDEATSADSAIYRVRSYAQAIENDLSFTFDAMKTTINQLSGVEGRKILVHVSGGLPQSPGAELWTYVQTKFPNSVSYSMGQFEFDKTASYLGIIQAANAAGVSMYTIDASGLSADTNVSAENRATSQHLDTFVERTNLQSMLTLMAEETGGRATLNRNDVLVPLKEMEKDYTSYYSLGYRSVRSGIDRPHKVDVRLKSKKGLTVLARRSYLEKGVDTKVREAVTSALFFPRDDNPLGAAITVGNPAPAERGNFIVPVAIRVPFSRFLIPEGEKDAVKGRGRLVFYFIVVDSEGKQSDLTTQPVPVELEPRMYAASSKRDFVYDAKLIMIPGGQRLSLAIRDDITNQTSYLQKQIFVSAFAGEAPARK